MRKDYLPKRNPEIKICIFLLPTYGRIHDIGQMCRGIPILITPAPTTLKPTRQIICVRFSFLLLDLHCIEAKHVFFLQVLSYAMQQLTRALRNWREFHYIYD